MDLMCN